MSVHERAPRHAVAERPEDLDYVEQSFKKRFGTSSTNSDFMLGVCRKRSVTDDGIRVLEYTMPDFIENVYEEYQEHIEPLNLKRSRTIPLEEGFILGPKEPQHSPNQDEGLNCRLLSGGKVKSEV